VKSPGRVGRREDARDCFPLNARNPDVPNLNRAEVLDDLLLIRGNSFVVRKAQLAEGEGNDGGLSKT
jgi:hypothetical protein